MVLIYANWEPKWIQKEDERAREKAESREEDRENNTVDIMIVSVQQMS